MSNIFDEMMKQYQDYASLKEFSSCQHDTIMQLSKKIDRLEKQKNELELMLKNSGLTPLLQSSNDLAIVPSNGNIITIGDNEENICKMELKKLNGRMNSAVHCTDHARTVP